ncbi:LysR family transcriptional regulator [Microbacterium sp. NPDC079208]|uniref:LysR family transcriptional regulator n=1 Tax=Microbacterium sp. NPDC079208 TaxID=3154652 RepID=UPI00344DD36E
MSDRVSVEALRYAQAVSETHSFGAAARAYGVTQPALSTGISKLEDRLGERLFERSPRGVVPTAFGAHLLPVIDRALLAVDQVAAEAARWNRSAEARVRVGVSPLMNPAIVARAYTAVCALPASPAPRQLVLREANVADLRRELSAGELDLILVPSVAPMPRFRHRIVDAEPVVVVDQEPSPDGPVELSDLTDAPLILMPDTCGLTTFTTDLFAANDVPLSAYDGEAATYRVLEEWAKLGLGTAVIPRSKLASPDAPHRPLRERGMDVEIFYEAVWDPSSPLADDLAELTAALSLDPAAVRS